MAVTAVTIANSALVKVGDQPISSLTEDNTRARAIHRIYEHVRDEVMRAHPWNFAIKRTILSPTGTTPDFGYTYEYDLPADNIRILEVEEDEIDYVVENSKILCDESSIEVRYIYRNEDENSWDVNFAEALAWRLAREIAYSLTQSSTLVEAMDKGYKNALSESRSMDGSEGIMKRLEADEWLNSRR